MLVAKVFSTESASLNGDRIHRGMIFSWRTVVFAMTVFFCQNHLLAQVNNLVTNFTLSPIGYVSTGFQFRIIGPSNHVYRVEGSTDLANWSVLNANVTGGSLVVVDPSVNALRYKFYRACADPLAYGPALNGIAAWFAPDSIIISTVLTNRVEFCANKAVQWSTSANIDCVGRDIGNPLANLGTPQSPPHDWEMPEYVSNGLAGYPSASFRERPDYGYSDGYRLLAGNFSGLASDTYTIFMAVRNWGGGTNSGGPLMRLWDTTTLNGQEIRIGYAGKLNLYSPAGSALTTNSSLQQGAVIEAAFLPASFASFVNGTNTGAQLNISGTVSSVPRGIDIGYNYLPANVPADYFGDFELSEVLIYTNSLSNADRNQTGSYLANKYGLFSSYSYQPAAAPVQLIDISGPPHGTWGNAITCNLSFSSFGRPSAGSATLTLKLRGTQNPGTPVAVLPVGNLTSGGIIEKVTTFTLPPAADPWGNSDGDYDLQVSYNEPGLPTTVFTNWLPIHIETRDSNGRISGIYVPRIYDFVGANDSPGRLPPGDWLLETGIRHSREHINWCEFEPQNGVWRADAFGPDSRLGSLILQARKYDMTIIPMVAGIPAWASTNVSGPPADPAEWQAFVDKLVGFYSKAPYYQQNWQIWNEAGGDPSKWTGNNFPCDYIDMIHNPAAIAIHSHYVDRDNNGIQGPNERCRIVYGGLPDNLLASGYYTNHILNYHGCATNTDIFDAHYTSGVGGGEGLDWFSDPGSSGDVYDQWVASGPGFGCWETECGCQYAFSPVFTPQFYWRSIAWAVAHNWNDMDKYRAYHFSYYAPTNSYECPGNASSGIFWDSSPQRIPQWPNRYSIKTLIQTLSGDLTPPDPSRSVVQSDSPFGYGNINFVGNPYRPLIMGGRLVFPFTPANYSPASPSSSTLTIALKPGEVVQSVSRVTFVMGASNALPFSVSSNNLSFTVTYKSVSTDPTGMEDPQSPYCYIVVQCTNAMAEERYKPAFNGLQAWYKPDSIAPDATYPSRVASWMNAAPSKSGTSPINLSKLNDQEMPEYISSGLASYPAAQFRERPDYGYIDGYRLSCTNSSALSSDTYTIFMVVQNWSGGANNGGPLMRLWDSTTPNSGELRMGYAGTLNLYSDAGSAISTNASPQNATVIEAQFLPFSFASYMNGTNTSAQLNISGIVSKHLRGIDFGYNYLPANAPASNYFGDFQLSEVLIYTNRLSDAERNQTGNYLANKYGLQSAYKH